MPKKGKKGLVRIEESESLGKDLRFEIWDLGVAMTREKMDGNA